MISPYASCDDALSSTLFVKHRTAFWSNGGAADSDTVDPNKDPASCLDNHRKISDEHGAI